MNCQPQDDAARQARALGISREAVELYRASTVIDLHIDSFIWQRVWGYDLRRRHTWALPGHRYWAQADLPRMREAGLAGALFVITTNPLRTRRGKGRVLWRNVARLSQVLSEAPGVRLVHDATSLREARAAGELAAMLAVQGGDALSASLDDVERLPPELVRVTLTHFTRSRLGAPALPVWARWGAQGLTDYGRELVRALERKRVFVDLAHLSPQGFEDVLAVHDRSRPLLISHGACAAVHRHWRNSSDAQLKAVADSGGVIGIFFQSPFLVPSARACGAEQVVDHLAHAVRTVGAEHVALGTDFDGAITPPRDLRTVLALPRLVEAMLRRGFTTQSVQSILGGSFLRAFERLRGAG